MVLRLVARNMLPILAVVFHIVMVDSWQKQFHFWYQSATYQHSFLILPVFVYLLWRQRDVLRRHSNPSGLGITALLALSTIWICAHLVNIEIIEFSAALLFFPATIWAYVGSQSAKILWFPLMYIGFALPWWSILSEPLQIGTAYAASEVLKISNIPIFVDGQFIHIPSGTFEIEQACAGLHFLIVALALASLVAFLEPYGMRDRIRLLASAIVLALVVNWLRVVIVIIVGHETDMAHPWVQDHRTFGWAIFLIALLPWLWWIWRWKREYRDTTLAPVQVSVSQSGNVLIYGVVGLLALSVVKLTLSRAEGRPEFTSKPLVQASNWGESSPLSRLQWNPVFPGATFFRLLEFTFEGKPIWYFQAEYEAQTQGVEMVSSTNSIAGVGWEYIEDQTLSLTNGMSVNVAQVNQLQQRDNIREIMYWYEVDGRMATTVWQEKYLELKSWLGGHRPRASVHALTSPYSKIGEVDSQAWMARAISVAIAKTL